MMKLYDKDWTCVWDSDTSELTLEEFMADLDWLNFREDGDADTRVTGRLTNEDGKIQRHTDAAYLTKIMNTPNPLFLPEYQFEKPTYSAVDELNRRLALDWQAAQDKAAREAWDRLSAALAAAGVSIQELGQTIADALKAARPSLEKLALALDVDTPPAPRPDGKPNVPRPARKPPMWANDPTKSRRRR